MSQTASDYIDEQLALEADAKEILPYKFDKCTYTIGPLRQSVFACLTCSPPPASAAQVYTAAGVCYSCSISCHGEHNLVELFHRRNFVCDCGTTRMPSTSPCNLRSNSETGVKGVSSQEAAKGNAYNHNFQNRFCGCAEEYDAHTEKGTMYQCLGLGTVESGGCGEDWWHPECLMGLPKDWVEKKLAEPRSVDKQEHRESADVEGEEKDEHPVPEGFPQDDEFVSLICYKCVGSNPWIKQYAGSTGFLNPVLHGENLPQNGDVPSSVSETSNLDVASRPSNLKRKASDELEDGGEIPVSLVKRMKEAETRIEPSSTTKQVTTPGYLSAALQQTGGESKPVLSQTDTESLTDQANTSQTATNADPLQAKHKHELLPSHPQSTLDASFSLFGKPNFRESLCHCPTCFPNLIPHPQLQEEEDDYEPSISDSERSMINGSAGGVPGGARSVHSHGSGSILDRGEAALSTMDRVKAIEGVMVYNHLRDKVKEFLRPYAESGQAVGAEDIKAYFEKLRGDEAAVREASGKPVPNEDGDGDGGIGPGKGDSRKEQDGY